MATASKSQETTVMRGENFYNENSHFQKRAINSADALLTESVTQFVQALLNPAAASSSSASSSPTPVGVKKKSSFFRFGGSKDKTTEQTKETESGSNNSGPMIPKALRIADLGCSQGANSQAPVALIIQLLRQNPQLENIPICVYHEDQITNDFNSFFKIMRANDDSYLKKFSNVFTYAEGKSFYEPLFPPESMHFMFSFTAIQWLSNTPQFNKIAVMCGDKGFSPENMESWARQSEEDLNNFLNCRATELVKGGKLVISALAKTESLGEMDFVSLVEKLIEEQRMTLEEALQFKMGVYFRDDGEFRKAFDKLWDRFKLEQIEYKEIVHPGYDAYKAGNITLDQFASMAIGFFRALFDPNLNVTLSARSENEKKETIERFWELFREQFQGNKSFVTSNMAFIHLTKI